VNDMSNYLCLPANLLVYCILVIYGRWWVLLRLQSVLIKTQKMTLQNMLHNITICVNLHNDPSRNPGCACRIVNFKKSILWLQLWSVTTWSSETPSQRLLSESADVSCIFCCLYTDFLTEIIHCVPEKNVISEETSCYPLTHHT